MTCKTYVEEGWGDIPPPTDLLVHTLDRLPGSSHCPLALYSSPLVVLPLLTTLTDSMVQRFTSCAALPIYWGAAPQPWRLSDFPTGLATSGDAHHWRIMASRRRQGFGRILHEPRHPTHPVTSSWLAPMRQWEHSGSSRGTWTFSIWMTLRGSSPWCWAAGRVASRRTRRNLATL